MKWTRNIPTVEGWYWRFIPWEDDHHKAVVVFLRKKHDGTMYMHGEPLDSHDIENDWWAGPLVIPDEFEKGNAP